MTCDFFYANNSFRGSDVRKCRSRDHISYGIVARHVGLVVVIYLDFALIHHNSNFFQSDIFKVGNYSSGRKYYLTVENFLALGCFDGYLTSYSFGIYLRHLGGGHDGDS